MPPPPPMSSSPSPFISLSCPSSTFSQFLPPLPTVSPSSLSRQIHTAPPPSPTDGAASRHSVVSLVQSRRGHHRQTRQKPPISEPEPVCSRRPPTPLSAPLCNRGQPGLPLDSAADGTPATAASPLASPSFLLTFLSQRRRFLYSRPSTADRLPLAACQQ